MIFTLRIQRFALLLRKNRSTDLLRFLSCAFVFLDMKTREHDLLSLRLFSPTDDTNFTSLFSLKCLFLPQIAQITRILFSFFRHEDMRIWFFITEIIISHGMHGMHGILFISHRWHRFFRFAQDFILLRYKITYNKIRSLTTSKSLYGWHRLPSGFLYRTDVMLDRMSLY